MTKLTIGDYHRLNLPFYTFQTHRGQRCELVGTQFWIDGELQSDLMDEVLYHETLVDVLWDPTPSQRVLIVGGGEGFVAREVLKHTNCGMVDMVDWDKDITDFWEVLERNASPKLRLYNDDVWEFLDHTTTLYDRVYVDLCDGFPNLSSLLHRLVQRLMPMGSVVFQMGGSLKIREPVYTELLKGYRVSFYSRWIPSFGEEWGFGYIQSTPIPVWS